MTLTVTMGSHRIILQTALNGSTIAEAGGGSKRLQTTGAVATGGTSARLVALVRYLPWASGWPDLAPAPTTQLRARLTSRAATQP